MMLNKRNTVWIFAGITPLLIVLAFLTFIGSFEIARIKDDPDGAIALHGFLATLVMVMLSPVCGMIALVLWWNQRAVEQLHL